MTYADGFLTQRVEAVNYGDEVVNPWEVIKIPAWLDEESAQLLDLPVGSSYFPEWKPEHVLQLDELEIKRHNGSVVTGNPFTCRIRLLKTEV